MFYKILNKKFYLTEKFSFLKLHYVMICDKIISNTNLKNINFDTKNK